MYVYVSMYMYVYIHIYIQICIYIYIKALASSKYWPHPGTCLTFWALAFDKLRNQCRLEMRFSFFSQKDVKCIFSCITQTRNGQHSITLQHMARGIAEEARKRTHCLFPAAMMNIL
jgi:hypothetical protein